MRSRTDEELRDLANELLQYDFKIVYQPGESNVEADTLSHNLVFESDVSIFYRLIKLKKVRRNLH